MPRMNAPVQSRFQTLKLAVLGIAGGTGLRKQMPLPTASLDQGDRCADSFGWYLRANTLGRIEACIFVAHFFKRRAEGLNCAQSMWSSYQFIVKFTQNSPQLEPDLALDLVARAEQGRRCAHPSELLATCSGCDGQYISSLGREPASCPFCELTVP